jgi:hypothetical protein
MRLRAIGFWRSIRDVDTTLPDPREFVDPASDPEERGRVADYLRMGRRLRVHEGKSRSRLCGTMTGSDEQTDGTYLWPEGLTHYVAEHAVKLPAEFLEHIARELDAIDGNVIDRGWWAQQRGTGTARHWTRYKVELGPCDARATSVIQQIAGGVVGWDRAERIYTELVRRGTAEFTLPSRAPAEDFCERLRHANIPCRIIEERVPLPDTLLG